MSNLLKPNKNHWIFNEKNNLIISEITNKSENENNGTSEKNRIPQNNFCCSKSLRNS